MTVAITHRMLSVAVVVVAMLALNACGSDSPEEIVDTTSVTIATDAATSEDPSEPSPDPDGSDDGGSTETVVPTATDPVASAEPEVTACTAAQQPKTGRFVVSGIAADDPDGGLIAHVAPGPSATSTGVFAEGTEVIVSSAPADCARLADGGIWWNVTTGGGGEGWVNSRFIARPSDVEEASNVAEICSLYSEVVAYEAGEEAVPGRLAESLNVAIDRHPVGVSAALDALWQTDSDIDRASAFGTIRGYLSPICE